MSLSTLCKVAGEEIEKRLHFCVEGLRLINKGVEQIVDIELAFLVWESWTVLTS
jgi:hypothetical protein